MGESLPCSEIILRGIQRKFLDWDPNREKVIFRADAFMLRRWPDGRVEQALSVHRLSLSTCEESFARWAQEFDGMWAARSLHTGRVQDLGLRVLSDDPADPVHAGIYDLPEPPLASPETDRLHTLAMQKAVDLHEMSRLAGFSSPEVVEKVREKYERRCKEARDRS